jgi:hypothetical protein
MLKLTPMRALALAVFVCGIAVRSFAVTYVVPPDRFEIERASAIVIGRVLGSHVEASRFGIETVTNISLEETIKGGLAGVVQVHEPGGTLGGETRLVPGVPWFVEGELMLLLLYQREDGTYVVSDLQLGSFRFVRDASGQELLVRDESEIEGWDIHGNPHREPHRSAESFLHYVRGIVRGEDPADDYLAEDVPSAVSVGSEAIHAAANAFTATSYLLFYGSGIGARWNVFPGTVSWNQGSSETGPQGSGTAEITDAFGIWNAGGPKYVLSSKNANANGFLDAPDGTNNIVFEKNLTSAGLQPFNCISGGALGMGGMTHANFGAGVHVFHGETFATTLEADVSMNQGLGACTTNQLPPSLFKAGIVHELGHTLGFRHSDQNRTLTASCSGDPTLDCSSNAIMNHILAIGLSVQRKAWDNAAVSAVYGSGPACTPPSITQQPAGSAITSGSAAQLSVTASGTSPFSYQWFTGARGDVSMPVNGGTAAAIEISPAVTTSLWVRVTGQCAPVANSQAAVVIVTIPCVPPQVTGVLKDQTVLAGSTVTLTLDYTGQGASVSWFQGANANPIGSGQVFVSPPLTQTTQFHARVANACGTADSNTVTITVQSPRRRPVLH